MTTSKTILGGLRKLILTGITIRLSVARKLVASVVLPLKPWSKLTTWTCGLDRRCLSSKLRAALSSLLPMKITLRLTSVLLPKMLATCVTNKLTAVVLPHIGTMSESLIRLVARALRRRANRPSPPHSDPLITPVC